MTDCQGVALPCNSTITLANVGAKSGRDAAECYPLCDAGANVLRRLPTRLSGGNSEVLRLPQVADDTANEGVITEEVLFCKLSLGQRGKLAV